MSSSDLAYESFAIQSGDPATWHELARTLMIAEEPIKRRLFEIANVSPNIEGIRLEQLAYVRAYMLLSGLAFENLIKAILLLHHHSIRNLPRGGHVLVAIVNSLIFSVDWRSTLYGRADIHFLMRPERTLPVNESASSPSEVTIRA